MKEYYNSFLFAALLHDIGKFYQRGSEKSRQHSHSFFSGVFIENFKDCFDNPNLIKTLVTHHHEQKDNETPKGIIDEKERMLAWLIDKADNFSSKERSDEDTKNYNPFVYMDSIFSFVNIHDSNDSKSIDNIYKYKLSRLYDKDNDINPIKYIDDNTSKDYESHEVDFTGEFKDLFENKKVNLDTLYSLIQNYLWCVPSDTTHKPHDVSLADHLKTTTAIAACSFKYHEEYGWNEKDVKKDSLKKWCLVAGDISGIQKYIYEIASIGHGGVAKRLRGRSFKIAVLTEAIAISILKQLDLPNMCKLISAGGMFYLLVPNTKEAIDKLNITMEKISRYLLNEYIGELSISYASIELEKDDFKIKGFNKALDKVKDELNKKKLQKFNLVFSNGSKIFDMEYKGNQFCPICDRYPATVIDDDIKICKYCRIDENIGKKLVSGDNWLVLSEVESELKLFDDELKLYVHIVSKDKVNELEPIIAYNMIDEGLIENVSCSYFPYTGYVPRWSDKDDFDNMCKKYPEIKEVEDGNQNFDSGKIIKSFSAIACEGVGHNLLGILRADVDNLGLIFSEGLEDSVSISRVSTLSTMLNIFFTKKITSIIKSFYKNVYTGYCGGDDLMLIGPYDDIINLSYKISSELYEYVANNNNITISAGIGTYKGKTPIAITSLQTESILERSKNSGKDALTVFDTSLKWKNFLALSKISDVFTEELEKDICSISFLYRLLEYQNMYIRYNESDQEGKLRYILYKPKLAYDVSKNFIKDNGEYKASIGFINIINKLLENNNSYWKLIKMPITWAAYNNRKKENKNV